MARAEKRQRKKEQRRQRIEAEVREWRGRRRRRLAINLAILGVVVGVIAWSVYSNASERRRAAERAAAEKESVCSDRKPQRGGPGSFESPPPMSIDQTKTYTAAIETSCGRVEIELADDTAPQTVNSFVFLARAGFFNGLTFHRLAPGFVVQGGDPSGNGSGGPGYQVVEPPPPLTEYPLGTVAMAKTGTDPPGASGSQFFMVTGARAASLNGSAENPAEYALLGKVISGREVLQKMEDVGTTGLDGPPREPIYIISIQILES